MEIIFCETKKECALLRILLLISSIIVPTSNAGYLDFLEIDKTYEYTGIFMIVYKDKTSGDYCYFEHADYNNKGIKKFKSYKDAVLYQMDKHIESNRKYNIINDDVLNRLVVYEFDIFKYECSMDEYISNILESKVIYENGEFCE